MRYSVVSLLALPLALAADPTIIKVGDEQGALTFSPDTATIPVGGVAEFHFYPQIHSVAQGTFEDPCKPLSNTSFFSGGFITSSPSGNATTFKVTITDDKPIYYYCGYPSHCAAGMVGIINPPSDTSKGIAAYKSAANGKTTVGTTGVRGGTVGPAGNASSSASPSSTTAAGGSGNTPSPTGSGAAATTSKSGAVANGFNWGFTSLAVVFIGATMAI